MDSLILPFNMNSLSSLNSNDDSELFIFYLDPGSKTGYSDPKYEYILECINSMKFSHATIIHEVSHNGILVDIFDRKLFFRNIC